MASCSTSLNNNPTLMPPPNFSYDSCNKTLYACSLVKLCDSKETPLYRCLYLIWNGQLDYSCFPRQVIKPYEMPSLNQACKTIIEDRLNAMVPVGGTRVAPRRWLSTVWELSREEDWKYVATTVNGSGLFLDVDYWKQYLSKFGKLHPLAIESFSEVLASPSTDCNNLDVVIYIQPGHSVDWKDRCVLTVIHALRLLTNIEKPPLKGFQRIGEMGVVFMIGNETCSFDLTVWFVSPHYGSPELFVHQGLCWPIHHLIRPDEKCHERPCVAGTTPSTLLAHKLVPIASFLPTNLHGVFTNIGIFKGLMVRKTKGYMGIQGGLEAWSLMVFLYSCPLPKNASHHARQSYREHLSQSPGALLAHRLHWMVAMQKVEKIKEQNPSLEIQLTRAELQNAIIGSLDHLEIENSLDHLRKTFIFLKRYPNHFPVLVTALEFIMLMEFLKTPGENVSYGMWEGNLNLRLRLDKSTNSYFQYILQPTRSFGKLYRFLRDSNVDVELKDDVKELIHAYMDYFNIGENFPLDPEALRILEMLGFKKEHIPVMWRLSKMTQEAYSASEHIESLETIEMNENKELAVSFADSPFQGSSSKKRKTISELIADQAWDAVKERLLLATGRNIPERRIEEFGNFVWQLFGAWASQWSHSAPPREVRKSMLTLLDYYIKALQITNTAKRSELFYKLIKRGCDDQCQLHLFSKHVESSSGLVSQVRFDKYLTKKISRCFENSLLRQYHALRPNQVYAHVITKFSSVPLPEKESLIELLTFFKCIAKDEFRAKELSIARQLTLEMRYTELEEMDLSVTPTEMLESIFNEFIEGKDFNKARMILERWRRYTNQPLIEKEAMLGESEGRERSSREWLTLLRQIKTRQHYNDLWESLHQMLALTNQWNASFEDVFIHLLKKSLEKQTANRIQTQRAQHLIPIISIINANNHIVWESKMSRLDQITFLVIKNLSEVAKTHPQISERESARTLGKDILNQVRESRHTNVGKETFNTAERTLLGRVSRPTVRSSNFSRARLEVYLLIYYWAVFFLLLGAFIHKVIEYFWSDSDSDLDQNLSSSLVDRENIPPGAILIEKGFKLIQGYFIDLVTTKGRYICQEWPDKSWHCGEMKPEYLPQLETYATLNLKR